MVQANSTQASTTMLRASYQELELTLVPKRLRDATPGTLSTFTV